MAVNRFMWSFLTAFCVIAGYVLSRFASEVVPTSFLGRPLAFAGLAALAVAAVSLAAAQHAVLMASAGALVVAWFNPWTLGAYVTVMAVSALAEHRGWSFDTAKPAVVATAVFAATSVVAAIPQLDVSLSAPAHASSDGPPVYLIMLDGYSSAKVFAELGVDIGPFIETMEAKGFTHYPQVESSSHYTHQILASMLTGKTWEGEATTTQKRQVRESLRLPDGFVTVSPGIGHVTIPRARDVGPGGMTDFDLFLARRSVLAQIPGFGNVLMEGWRNRIEGSLDVIPEHDRVFAHIMAPHAPYLYGPDGPIGAPDCWPECGFLSLRWIGDPGLAPTVEWLNRRLVETVDAILDRHPDAQIVVFGDHGLRVRGEAPEDAFYKPLLLARSVDFSDPRPDAVFSLLDA